MFPVKIRNNLWCPLGIVISITIIVIIIIIIIIIIIKPEKGYYVMHENSK